MGTTIIRSHSTMTQRSYSHLDCKDEVVGITDEWKK